MKILPSVPTVTARISPRRTDGRPPPDPSPNGSVPDQFWTVGVNPGTLAMASYFNDTSGCVFSVQTGPLPSGRVLNQTTGDITGTPTAAVSARPIVIRCRNTTSNVFADQGFSATVDDPPVGDTTIAFGALTLANSGGIPLPVGAASIESGTAGGYTVLLGYVVPTANGSAGSGTIVFNNGVTWTVSTQANTYSVRTVSEMVAVNQLGAATLAGKTMRLRPGTYDVVNTSWLTNRSFPSTFTIASHDTRAFPGIGSASHDRVKIITHRDKIANSYNGMARIIFDGLCVEGRFDRTDTTARQYIMDGQSGSLTDAVWQYCWLKGDDDVIGAEGTFDGFLGRYDGGFNGPTGVAFRHCRVSHMHRLLTINRPGRREMTNCQFDNYSLDAAVVGWSGQLIFTDNFIFGPSGDRSFVDWQGGAKASRDGAITGMADGTKGIFFARIGNGTSGVRQVMWTLQALGGTAYAALEWTTLNKLYFWAKDSGGTKRVELTSTITPKNNYFYNVLVSVDNAGAGNKMLLWESVSKQGAQPVKDVISQGATGHTLRWAAGGMAIGAENVGTGGTANFNGSMGRWLFHPGTSLDVESPAVQAAFWDLNIGSGPIVEDYSVFGGPPVIDIKPSLAEWRTSADTGQPVPNGGTGESVVLRTGRASVEAGHVDALQSITNPAAQSDSGPITVERNVMIGHNLDGTVSANGGQGFFFEDIQKSWVHITPFFKNNLLVFAGPHGISMYNPDRAKILHNTLVAPPILKASTSHLIKVRYQLHNTGDASTRNQDLANGCIRSTIAHDHVLDANITSHIDSPDTHPVLFDNTKLPNMQTDAEQGNYFAGMNGNGTGFTWSDLTDINTVKQMYATNQSLNPAGVVKVGWDAYWNEPSPWNGTCDDLTIPGRTGAGESASIVPLNVSAGGIAVHTNNTANIEQKLINSNDTDASGWTQRPLHLMAGQKFRVRRLSGTGTTTVYFGNQTATWTVS